MRPAIGLLLLAVAPGFAAGAERSLPLFFFPNTGQVDPSIRYVVETPDLRAGFQTDGVLFQIHRMNLRVRFAGANARVAMEAQEPMPGKANFLIGNRSEDWKTGVPTYHKIRYRRLYPGIDMTYGGTDRLIKSEFLVTPGANPAAIRLEYSGVDRVSIDTNGDLVVGGAGVELREQAPGIYQETALGRVAVKGRYRMLGARTVGFEIEAYDASQPLVIDPVLSYATYLGGSGQSAVTGLAADASGNLYVTGWTEALNFPIAGAFQAANQGGVDAFVVKLNPAGTSFVYATYIGGRGDDRGAAIAVNASGQAYVTGSTASTNFPLVSPIRSTLGGSRTAFALKLSALGNTLVYSTYLGGTNYEVGTAIAIDGADAAYIAGDTQSANFPVTGGAQTTLGGGADAFVAKLTSAGALAYGTFLGGSGTEHAGGIAVDASGNAYVAGGTNSTNFPVASAMQSANGGGQDAFVTKINSAGSAIVYGTYLGGNGGTSGNLEQANAIAVDSSGSAYVAGVTNSTNFPLTAGALQVTFNGMQDAFVAKFSVTGSTLVYSTYLGGTGYDAGNGIKVDSSGNAYVTGYTSSPDFVTVSPVQTAFNGLYDAFVAELNAAGGALLFSTYYGGAGSDVSNAMALDPSRNIYVGGQTSSADFPLQTPIQSANSGGNTGWLLRLAGSGSGPSVPSAISVSPSSGSGYSATFTAQFSDTAGAASLTTVGLLVNASASTSYGCYVTYSPAANLFYLANDTATSTSSVLPGGGSASNSYCTLNGTGSSAILSGTNLTLTVVLSFLPNFPGAKTVYLYVADANSNTSLVSRGSWTVVVPPPVPSIGSVSPNGATGSAQTFTFVYNDTQSANNFTAGAMLFSNSPSGFTNACFVVYDALRATLQVQWDNNLGNSIRPITSSTPLSNSQCTVGAASATVSGLSLIVTVGVTFKASFNGLRNIYMNGTEGPVNTGWVLAGAYNVQTGGFPVANSVVPAAGTGPSQRYSFTVSDQGGAGFVWGVAMLFSTSLSTTNACSISYDRSANVISLSYDNPANGATVLTLGSSTAISNSQCTVNGANTTVALGVTTVVVTVDVAFNAAFFGAKNTYLYASEPGVNSGWVQVGSWTVTGGAPTADSVSPPSGSGNSTTFSFNVSDSANSANIIGMSMLITAGAPSATANACYMSYNRTAGTIGLYNDTGTVLSTKAIGSSANLSNNQCSVGFTVMFTSGNSVQLQVQVVFKTPAFNGSKSVYLLAAEPNTTSGWVLRGTWIAQ
jgi:hypothetical protein